MAKRFTDTEIWNDPWYREMKTEGKIFWSFLKDRCDAAGFWKKDYKLASFQCGIEISDELLRQLNEGKERVKDHGEHLEIVQFVEFQYGVLKDEVKPHRPILRLMENYKLKGYRKGINTPKDKEKEKDKETETETVVSFDDFWKIYPKKAEKKKAEEKWNRLSRETQELILKDLPRRKETKSWKEGFILNPMTYLNGERWNDELKFGQGSPPPPKIQRECQDCGAPTYQFLCDKCISTPRQRNPKLEAMKSEVFKSKI